MHMLLNWILPEPTLAAQGCGMGLEPEATTERRPRVRVRGPGDITVSNPCLSHPKITRGGQNRERTPILDRRMEEGPPGPRPRGGNLTSASCPVPAQQILVSAAQSDMAGPQQRGVRAKPRQAVCHLEVLRGGQEAVLSHRILVHEVSVLIYRVPCHGGA